MFSAMYQLMFESFTAGIDHRAIAERMKFAAVLVFVAVWMFEVSTSNARPWVGNRWLYECVWNPGRESMIDFAVGH